MERSDGGAIEARAHGRLPEVVQPYLIRLADGKGPDELLLSARQTKSALARLLELLAESKQGGAPKD
jgi:hypothetical protein